MICGIDGSRLDELAAEFGFHQFFGIVLHAAIDEREAGAFGFGDIGCPFRWRRPGSARSLGPRDFLVLVVQKTAAGSG